MLNDYKILFLFIFVYSVTVAEVAMARDCSGTQSYFMGSNPGAAEIVYKKVYFQCNYIILNIL